MNLDKGKVLEFTVVWSESVNEKEDIRKSEQMNVI